MEYTSNIIATMSDNTTPSPQVASANIEYTTNLAWKAFDANNATYWYYYNGSDANGVLTLDFGANKRVARYAIYPYDNAGSVNPTAWTFQGSNNGSSWDTLDSRTGVTWTDSTMQNFDIASPATYRYYRIVISNAQTPSNGVLIKTLEMYEEVVTTNIKKVAGVAYASIGKIMGVAKASIKKIAGVA